MEGVGRHERVVNGSVAHAIAERVEDLEDLRDLGEAIVENAGKPLIPWEEVKKDLDLD